MDLEKIVADLKVERDRLERAIMALEGAEARNARGSRVAGPTKRVTNAAPRTIPTAMERARQRFEGWRKTRQSASPIPEALWALAVEVARAHGVNKTAQSLRLNYNTLKTRVKPVDGPAGSRTRSVKRGRSC
ncbi:MAG: hypothetical protein ACRD18_16075 [Terriglobia bacterium]